MKTRKIRYVGRGILVVERRDSGRGRRGQKMGLDVSVVKRGERDKEIELGDERRRERREIWRERKIYVYESLCPFFSQNALKCDPNTLSNQFPENCFYEKLMREQDTDAPDAKSDANRDASDASDAALTQPLRIVVSQSPEQDHGLFDMIRDYLAQTLNVPVQVEFVQKWEDTKRRIENGEADLGE
jgi:hypothetical protein